MIPSNERHFFSTTILETIVNREFHCFYFYSFCLGQNVQVRPAGTLPQVKFQSKLLRLKCFFKNLLIYMFIDLCYRLFSFQRCSKQCQYKYQFRRATVKPSIKLFMCHFKRSQDKCLDFVSLKCKSFHKLHRYLFFSLRKCI